VLLAAFWAQVATAEEIRHGAIKLDSLTFDKAMALGSHISWLLRFADYYSLGRAETTWQEISGQAVLVKNFFLADLPCHPKSGASDEDDKNEAASPERVSNEEVDETIARGKDGVNLDIMERFNITFEDKMPVFVLINEANPRGLKFDNGLLEEDRMSGARAPELLKWLGENGVPIAPSGTLQEFNELVRQFHQEGFPSALIDKAKQLAEESYKDDRKAALYAHYMQKVQEKGEGWAMKEVVRQYKVLTSPSTSQAKTAELFVKTNILQVFAKKGNT